MAGSEHPDPPGECGVIAVETSPTWRTPTRQEPARLRSFTKTPPCTSKPPHGLAFSDRWPFYESTWWGR